MLSRKRKIIRGVAILVLFVTAVILLLPVWLPWVLGPVAGQLGVRFGSYERLGYQRFAIHDAVYQDSYVRFSARRLETSVPTVVLWSSQFGEGSDVKVHDWSLEVFEPNKTNRPSPGTNTLPFIISRVETILDYINYWLPRAALTNGSVTLPWQKGTVPWLVSSNRDVNALVHMTLPRVGETPIELSLRRPGAGVAAARLAAEKLRFQADLLMQRTSEEVSFVATNHWKTNQFVTAIHFGRNDWPSWATLSAPALHFTAAEIPLAGYEDLHGSVSGAWTNGAFDLNATFDGSTTDPELPRVQAALHVEGDTNVFRLRDLHVKSLPLSADLSSPMEFNYRGELLSGPVLLSVTANLDQVRFATLRGVVGGDIRIEPVPDAWPHASFQLSGTNVGGHGLEMSMATVKGGLRWPLLQVDQFQGRLSSGADVAINGLANLPNRFVSNATVRAAGMLPTNVIPWSVQYTNANIVAEIRGPLTNLAHQATVTAQSVRYGALVPFDLAFRERGQQFALLDFNVSARGARAALEVEGSGAWNATNTTLQLKKLNLSVGELAVSENELQAGAVAEVPVTYSLERAVDFLFSHAPGTSWRLQMSPLEWRGLARKLDLTARARRPLSGDAQFTVSGVRASDFTNLVVSAPAVEVLVQNLNGSLQWSNGPVILSLDAAARIALTNSRAVGVTFSATNTPQFVHVRSFEAALDAPTNSARKADSVLGGEAVLPVSATGSTNGFAFQLHRNAPARLQLHTITNESLPRLFEEFLRTRVRAPAIHVSLAGTLNELEGNALLSAASVMPLTLTNEALPEVKDVSARIVMNREALRLEELRAAVAGQSIFGTAEVPLAKGMDWRSRLQVDKAVADLRVAAAELAAFAPFATNILAPRGTLDVNLAVRPGLQLEGHVFVTNAATVAFPTIGPIDDVDARIVLRNETVALESGNARVGGSYVNLGGSVDFAKWKLEANRWPSVRLKIAGTNIALVREAQKIIRTDLDLTITNMNAGPPVVGGLVSLRESLFLAELADLVPRGATRPSERPPYFSVDTMFVRDWLLDVRVHGDRFLRLRTPFFRGQASADLHLAGTLLEPRALGDLKIDAGRINFPFATLNLEQGFVTLASADPYRPRLFLTAKGNAFDYEIRIEITGTAQRPILQFSSIPPLTSEQIMLMVTSGHMPRTDYALSTEQRAQRLGMFVGKNLLTEFGFGGSGEKLTIHSGESVSESGRETYSIEYKLTEELSLIGEYDRFDEYNGGIKWRIFSR